MSKINLAPGDAVSINGQWRAVSNYAQLFTGTHSPLVSFTSGLEMITVPPRCEYCARLVEDGKDCRGCGHHA